MVDPSRDCRRARIVLSAAILAICALVVSCTDTAGRAVANSSGAASTTTSTMPTPSTTEPSNGAPTDSTGAPATTGPTGEPVADPTTGTEVDPSTLPVLSEAEPKPQTRTEELRLKITRHGSATLQDAIDIFDITVDDLPGATASTLPDGDGFSLDEALAIIRPYQGRLSGEQRAIVDGYLDPGEVVARVEVPESGAPTVVTGGGGSAGPLRAAPATTAPPTGTGPATEEPGPTTDPTGAAKPGAPTKPSAPTKQPKPDNDKYAAMLLQAVTDWRAYKAGILDGYRSFSLVIAEKQSPKHPDWLMSTNFDSSKKDCTVTVWPLTASSSTGDAFLKLIFAHELFHCHQGLVEAQYPPGWLREGSADWASYDLYRGKLNLNRSDAVDPNWFRHTDRSLEARDYDAWPLFETLRQQLNADPYPSIDAMLRNDNQPTEAILAAGGLNHPVFSSEWSSAVVRSTRTSSPVWQFDWPGVNPRAGGTDIVTSYPTQGLGALMVESLPSWTHRVYQVPYTSKVGVVRVRPLAGPVLSIANGSTVTEPEGEDTWFCLDSGGCQCPADTEPVMDLAKAQSPLVFAFQVRKTKGQTVADAQKWDPEKFCKKKEKRKRTGNSSGDPHLRTLDGLTYDAMHNGEFVAVTDPAGGLTVQERHQPVVFGAGNTAIAVGTGEHRVTLTTTTAFDDSVTVRLDGVVTTEEQFTAGEVRVESTFDGEARTWTFEWPDGSQVKARLKTAFFLGVSLPAERATRVKGLLGNGNGNFLDDLALPDGTPATGLDALQDAWLVSSKTSLFDYEAGQTSESFRTPPPKPVTPKADEEKRCRELLGPQATESEIRSCAYDVTATGDDDWATAYIPVVQDRVQAAGSGPATTATATSSAATTSSSGAVPTTGRPALTLAGTIGPPGTIGTPDSLSGTVHLTAGSSVILRASCPSDPDVTVLANVTNESSDALSILCGNRGTETYQAGPGDETPPGESYLLVEKTDDYQVKLSGLFDTPIALSVDVYADPEPLVVGPGPFPADGVQGTLTGVGDSAVVWVNTGSGEQLDLKLDGDKALCSQLSFGAVSPQGVDAMHGACLHAREFHLLPNTPTLPIIIFSRTDGPSSFTLSHG